MTNPVREDGDREVLAAPERHRLGEAQLQAPNPNQGQLMEVMQVRCLPMGAHVQEGQAADLVRMLEPLH